VATLSVLEPTLSVKLTSCHIEPIKNTLPARAGKVRDNKNSDTEITKSPQDIIKFLRRLRGFSLASPNNGKKQKQYQILKILTP
jgi:hypothetical protein